MCINNNQTAWSSGHPDGPSSTAFSGPREFAMRRTLAAIAATIMAMSGPGAAGTGNAAEHERHPTAIPFGVYISEFATRSATADGEFKEFIEFCNKGFATVDIGGLVLANLGTRIIPVAVIPQSTLLTPGSAYLLASTSFTGAIPDQFFNTGTDIPDSVGIALLNWTGKVVDAATTTYFTLFLRGAPAAPLTPADAAAGLSLTRVNFTGNTKTDFAKLPATPGQC
jgi:hypothetical protein